MKFCKSESVTAFTQNQREEVRILGNTAGSVTAEPGMHQQTYIAVRKCGYVLDGTKQHFTVGQGNVCHTLTAQMGNGTGYVPVVSVEGESYAD